MRSIPVAGVVVALIAVLGGQSASTQLPAPLVLEPCHVDRLAEEVLCGVHEVFEDRQSRTGRVLSIHVTVLPPLRRSAQPDPLFILAGGPGQGARSYAVASARYLQKVRRTRAIVLVDLRGTGASNALSCLAVRDEMAALTSGANAFLGDGAACAKELVADPRQYTHASALADLDEVRQRLGYGRINLWGGSWGTRAALLYALSYPDAVRSVVLDGAVPLGMGFPVSAAADADRALDQLFERCARDPSCAAEFPSPRAELATLLDRLRQSPAQAIVRHPRTGATVAISLARDSVSETLRVMLYTLTDAGRLMRIVRQAANGEFAPLAAQYAYSMDTVDTMALGTTMAILCSEDVPLTAGQDYARESGETLLGSSYAETWRRWCGQWPAGPPLTAKPAATSPAPALILSGMHDPVTPPRWGEAMARHFPNAYALVVPGAAHNTTFTGCVPDLIAAFLDRGQGGGLDARCLADAPLPALVTNDAGGHP